MGVSMGRIKTINKNHIHTTLSKECTDWLHKESIRTGHHKGKIIETAIEFYKNNKEIFDEYKQARIFLKEIIKAELLEESTKAKPLFRRLILEEIKALQAPR